MKVNGWMTNSMVRDKNVGQMVQNLKVLIKKAENTVKVNSYGRMGLNMKVIL